MKPSERINAAAHELIRQRLPNHDQVDIGVTAFAVMCATLDYLDEQHALDERRRAVLRAIVHINAGQWPRAFEALDKAGLEHSRGSADAANCVGEVLRAAEREGLL